MNTSDRTYLATAFLSEDGLEKSARGIGSVLFNTMKSGYKGLRGAARGKTMSQAVDAGWDQLKRAPGAVRDYGSARRGAKDFRKIQKELLRNETLSNKAKLTLASNKPGPWKQPDAFDIPGINQGPWKTPQVNAPRVPYLPELTPKELRGDSLSLLRKQRADLLRRQRANAGLVSGIDSKNPRMLREGLEGVEARHTANLLQSRRALNEAKYGVAALGTGAGLGAVGAGNKALNIAGQMSAPGSDSYQMATNDAWNQAASANRLAMLFNPQGEYQRIAQSLAASAPQKSWTRLLPGFGFSAGREDAQRKMYQDMAQGMQGMQLPLSARLAYAMNPENTVSRMRDNYRQQGYQV
jgi:hypothetical protein